MQHNCTYKLPLGFRNEKFGPPASIAQSLWAGVMTWRRWRQYIIVSPELSLTRNFISRSHYLTLELLAHAGINYLLCLYYSFPNLSILEYSLRHTGNCSLEAIHGTFRGGTSSLPITSPNLSFMEFLMRMNKAQQIQSAEHVLKKTEGSSIVASKKKRRTFASSSNEPPSSVATHVIELPVSYDRMMKELNDACHRGDADSKLLIEKLTPTMAELLKAADQWDSPSIHIEGVPTNIQVVDTSQNVEVPNEDIFMKPIEAELGPIQEIPVPESSIVNPHEESHQALANLLVDTHLISYQDTHLSTPSTSKGLLPSPSGVSVHVTSLLKDLQPQREKPSKDRARRFAAGDMPSDVCIPTEDEVQEFQYWALNPEKKALQKAKVFLLGRIIVILKDGKPVRSAEKCPDTSVVFTIFQYCQSLSVYKPHGKTALVKATTILLQNVTSHTTEGTDGNITVDTSNIDCLASYVPFTEDVDIQERLNLFNCPNVQPENTESEDIYTVEKIVEKKFNNRLGQYEFLVKWKDYSSRFNTWELASNIPDSKLQDFEHAALQSKAQSQATETPQSGLRNRETRRLRFHPDFIANN